MKRVAVIPARGGSKRIERKNIKLFNGKPIIKWAIEAAQQSGCFDSVIVSTDDDEIADISVKSGAEIPFTRPAELANDYAGIVPVVAHATQWLSDNRSKPDSVCCIFATAPFLEPDDLANGLQMLMESDVDYVFSATEFPFPIQRAISVDEDMSVKMFMPEHAKTRSQDLTPAYHDAGQFYWGKSDAWLSDKPIFSETSKALIIPRIRAQDIDTPEDWDIAEKLFVSTKGTQNH